MLFNTTITLEAGEKFAHSPDEAAVLVLEALGGDLKVDRSVVQIVEPPVLGMAGAEPIPR